MWIGPTASDRPDSGLRFHGARYTAADGQAAAWWIGRRGGYVSHAKLSLPPYPVAAKAPHGDKAAADRPRSGGYPVATEVIASGLCDATVSGQALYDLKAWIVYGCNLLQALPDCQETY